MKKKYFPTAQIDDAIRKAYASREYGAKTGAAIKELAARLRWPRAIIYRRAVQIGAAHIKRKEPPWSEDEQSLLEKNAHKDLLCLAQIFRRAGYPRTSNAIGIRIRRHMAGLQQARIDHGLMSGRQASQCLGIDEKTLRRYIHKGWLKADRRETARTEVQGGDPYVIREKDLRTFVIEYVEYLHFGRMDKLWLVELLTGGVGVRAA